MSMMKPIFRQWNRLVGGGGEFSVTVPVMDGPLKPNNLVDEAESLLVCPGADNVVADGERLLFSQGAKLLEWDRSGRLSEVASLDANVTAIAVGPDGSIAAGLVGAGVEIVGSDGGRRRIEGCNGERLSCVTDLCFLADGTLAIGNGSRMFTPDRWSHDLLDHGASGFVALAGKTDGEAKPIVDGLRYPSGLCTIEGSCERLAGSETWSHRVIEVSIPDRKVTRTLVDRLPSYPARIRALPEGGYVLANHSVRSQLVEFVLREKRYLRRMREEVAPEYWIAPTYRSGDSFKEPRQAGGIIRLGIHKPWAPTRSYGLLVGLSPDFRPVWSAHCRADGNRHGLTSVVPFDGGLATVAKSNGELVWLNMPGGEDVPAKGRSQA